jgi:hypothetical protein
MKGKVKRTIKEASKLHGATAGFVSLVDAGANETPFTLIKSKNGGRSMAIKKRKAVAKSHKAVNPSRKKAADTKTVTEMAKMVFDGDVFEDEDAVRAHIEAAEWDVSEGIVVTKTAEGDFEARIDGMSDDDYSKLGKVDSDDEGVTYFVGERTVEVKSEDDPDDEDEDEDDEDGDDDAEVTTKSGPEEDDEDEDDESDEGDISSEEKGGKKKPYSKADDGTDNEPKKLSKRAEFLAKRREQRASAKKFNAWDTMFSTGNTIAKALKDGMEWDGIPPGVAEVQLALSTTVGNILKDEGLGDGKQDALNKAASDFAEIVGGLDTFFSSYIDADPEAVEKAFEDPKSREALAKWADDFADFVEEAAPAPVAKKVAKSVTPAAPDAAIDYKVVAENVADLVKKAVEPVLAQVSEVSEAVEALATRHPTKKAASPEDGGSAARETSSKADKAKEGEERWAKSVFG